MRRFLLALVVACAVSAPASAVGPEWSALQSDPDYRQARDRIDHRDWPAARRFLDALLVTHPTEPEVWSWIGFVVRSAGDPDEAMKYYERALSIDPHFLPALEYQGHGFLAAGHVERARGNLARLESLCGRCAEAVSLADAINAAPAR